MDIREHLKEIRQLTQPKKAKPYCEDYYICDRHVVAECKVCQKLMEEKGYGHGV